MLTKPSLVTQLFGKIDAIGGLNTGNGELVEVSSKELLLFQGLVDWRSRSVSAGISPAYVFTCGCDRISVTSSQVRNMQDTVKIK